MISGGFHFVTNKIFFFQIFTDLDKKKTTTLE